MAIWGHNKAGRAQGKLCRGSSQPVSLQHNGFHQKWQLQSPRNVRFDKPCLFCDSSLTSLLPRSRHRVTKWLTQNPRGQQSKETKSGYAWFLGIPKMFTSTGPPFLSVTAASVSSTKEKGTKINKPTKLEERSSDCPFHRDGHFPQGAPCWYYDVYKATPEAGDRLFLACNITGAYYHWGPFQLRGVREVIRVTPNLHLANRRVGTSLYLIWIHPHEQ